MEFRKIILLIPMLFILVLSGCAKITPSPGEAITDDERIELRAIVVPTSDQAEEIYKELKGGRPFWLLAQERSVHASSREGGFLGLVRKKELGREYQKALEGLKEGEYSGVFKTGDGYYATVQLTTTRYFKKALDLYLNGSLDEAAEGFVKDLAFNSDNIYSYMTLGIIYDQKKDYEKAIEMHKAALELDPSNETIYNNLATTYFNSDRPKAAIETYKRALEISPDSANIKNNLAWVYANEGTHLDEEITIIKELIDKEPGKAKYIETLSELYYRKGMYDNALREIRKAIEIEPNNENLRIQSKKIEDAKNKRLQPLAKKEKEGLDVSVRFKDSAPTAAPLRKELMTAKAAEEGEEKKTAPQEKEKQKKEVVSGKDEKAVEKEDQKKILESEKKEKEIVAKADSNKEEFGPGSGWEEIKPPIENRQEKSVGAEKEKTKTEPETAMVKTPTEEKIKREAGKALFDKRAARNVRVKIVIQKKGDEKEIVAALRKMGYKVSMVGKSEKHIAETTIYFKKGFRDTAERINEGLKGEQLIKPLTWESVFDIIISVRD